VDARTADLLPDTAMTASLDLAIEVLRDDASLEALSPEWRELPQAQASPLLSPDWFVSAARTLTTPAHALALRRRGELVGVAPLCRDGRAGVARLQPLGARALLEPTTLLYRDAASLDPLCRALIAQRRPMILQRIPASDPVLPAMRAAAARRGMSYEIPSATTPVVTFAGDGDVAAFEATLSSRRRQDFRRARRGLERHGAVTFDLRSPTPATVDADLDEALRIEAASWKSRGGTTLLRHPRVGAFFRDYTRRMAAQGKLRIAFLRVAGTGIAMQLFVEHASRFWIYKIGYDERWADHSPGVQLMWELMRQACAARLAGVELLGTTEPWLTIWAKEFREYRTLVYYPFNARGACAIGADALHAAVQRLRAARR
jgi:CelD/BcsL family acetyltransferase involved in cellulose biosynthesis